MKRKKITTHKKTSKKTYSRRKTRGAVGSGTMYVIVILLLITAAAFLFMGGQLPTAISPTTGTPVIPISNTPQPGKTNLQLYTFGFTTLAPTTAAAPALCTDKSVNTEPEILGYPNSAITTVTVTSGGQIKVWVNDENAPIMAPGEKADTTTGALTHGDTTAKAPDGYLWEPAIYISPQTAESGGAPHFPDFVKGDYQSGPNSSNLNGAQPIDAMPPGGISGEQYHAEYIWDVNKLGLALGTYSVEFIIHDGDHDRGIGCVTVVIQ